MNGAPLLLAAALLAALPGAPAAEAPFPAGTSSHTLEGLRCSVVMPEAFDPAKERSLVVVLHGNGGTETGMAGSLQALAEDDFVVVAPKSTDLGWEKKSDTDAVRRIVADLKKRLRVGEGRLHAVGFSNGGWNLAPVAFDEDLRFASATWVAAGYKGGGLPKHAKKGLGVLALAGAKDGNRDAAEKTVDLLEGKVRSVECRIQPDLGHEWPDRLVPYLRWWLQVQEGRFEPGRCAAFEWIEDPAAARAEMGRGKRGGFAYWYSGEQAADPAAKAFQNETLRDPLVQRFGTQLVAWKRDRAADAADFAAAGLKETPAVVVFDAGGKPVKVLAGPKIAAPALAAALRSVAADKTIPKR